MAISIVRTTYGPAAAEALEQVVAHAQAGDRLRPVTLLVPTNYVGVATRRWLAGRAGGLAGVQPLTVYRLAELLGGPALASQGRRPVSTSLVAAALRVVLRDDPGVLGPVAEHPSTVDALVAAHRALRDVDDAGLARLARTSARAATTVRLHQTVERRLGRAWFDEADLLEAASAAVSAGSPFSRSLGSIVLYLPQDLSNGESAFLTTLAGVAPLTVVAAVTGCADADEGVERSLRRLGAPPVVEAPAAGPPPFVAPADVRVVTASDPDDEVRAVVRALLDAARDGVAFERMVVVHPSPGPYGRLLAEHLGAAGVPWNGPDPVTLVERVAGRALLGLAALDERGWRRDEVFALLSTVPHRRPDGRPVPVAAWERVSREAGIVGGDDWDERLARQARSWRAEADLLAEDDEGGARAAALGRRADDANALRSFVLDLRRRACPPARAWQPLAEAARRYLNQVVAPEAEVRRWPAAEAEATGRVDALLERLAALDTVDPDPGIHTFRRAVDVELRADLARVGRLGHGVAVGPIGLALGLDVDVVVVVGLAEGVLPTRPGDDPLLPDRERAVIADRLPLVAEQLGRQHRGLLAAVATARARVVLTSPRGDLRQHGERQPSRWLLELASALAGKRLGADDLADEHWPWLHAVPSFAGGLLATARPATANEVRVRALGGSAHPARHPLVTADLPLSRSVDLIAGRRTPAFTAYDGNLAGVALPSPFDGAQLVSPSRLEAWSSCPFAYFAGYVLGVRPVELPEEVVELSPLERGSLVHQVLERFVRAALDRPGGPPAPGSPWGTDGLELLRRAFDEVASAWEATGVTGRGVFWQRARRDVWRQLAAFLVADDRERAALAATPADVELSFGEPGGLDPVVVELGDGRMARFRGRIDRLDRTADGGAVVIDYKTGKAGPYLAISPTDPTAGATRFQLPVYALAARPLAAGAVRARYWFLTSSPSDVSLELDDHLIDRLREALRVVADGIEAGCFPLRPPPPSNKPWIECPYCDPDGLGTAEAYRRWLELCDDPVLAGLPGREVADAT